jgi:hypothetical protein
MSCSFTEKISSLIDGELETAEAREVERHVLTCGECEQVKADFLSLRSQIAGFETFLQPEVQNRELKKILSRGDRRAVVPALRWGWTTPAIAFATLLVVGAIIAFVFYQTSNTNQRAPQQIAVTVETPSPVPSPEPSPEPTKEEKESETPKRANPPAPVKNQRIREPKPGEQFALIPDQTDPTAVPERVRPADAQTLTAIHIEKSETLLVAFRNVRLDTPRSAAEVAYERKRARQLVYQNMILRREADASGDVHIASLLESLEPILLDIANLPDNPDSSAIRTIRERVERKNIVPLLQVNSNVLARALD